MQKVCRICKCSKSADMFSKSSTTSDSLHTYCKSCNKEYMKEYYKKNKENQKLSAQLRHEKDPSVRRARRKATYAANKEEARLKTAEWKRLNKDKVNSTKAKRRSMKLNATPSWLTEQQHEAIRDFYWLATDLERVTGESYHVDHIVPLQGKLVCGLHVPWNLQILPATINASKGNTYEY